MGESSPLLSHHNSDADSCDEKISFWHSKNAVILVVSMALFTDMLVYDAILPLLPEILVRANSSTSNSGLMIAAYAFGLLFATPFLSFWSDLNRDRITPIILGQLGLIISTIGFIFARSLSILVISRILQGIKRIFYFRIRSFSYVDSWPRPRC